MLVYAPGQFFAGHQDSEKYDDMIGSLVVVLPSASSGGATVVTHHRERMTVRGSSKQIVCVAFYADRRHGVRPVTTGHRVALTFALRATAGPSSVGCAVSAAKLPDAILDALTGAVRRHLAAPIVPRYGPSGSDRPAQHPDRLVFLLDHEYTERGLAWPRLKNGDAVRAAALREVAVRLDCDVELALAEVHEAWQCEDDDLNRWSRRRGWGYGGDDDDDDDDDDDEAYEGGAGEPEHPELLDLIDTDVELRKPGKAAGKKAEYADFGAEVCWIKPSLELRPFNWAHEGYTGNAGNTVDRWYHRAAVVLTPRARAFTTLAKRSPSQALARIGGVVGAGTVSQARALVRELVPVWDAAVRAADDPGLAVAAMRVACDLGDAELAAMLLRPLALPPLGAVLGGVCGELATRYGAALVGATLESWVGRGRHDERGPWLAGAAEFCAALGSTRHGAKVARRWVEQQWAWIGEHWPRVWQGEREAKRRASAIIAVLRASVGAGAAGTRREILAWLGREPGAVPRGWMAVLRAAIDAQMPGEPSVIAGLGLLPVLEQCLAALEQALAVPVRERGDWSIGWDDGCGCKLCERLADFLEDEGITVLEWPIGKPGRRHLHGMIDRGGLPVSHETRRGGSPQVLVLRKQAVLFEREARERRWCVEGLAWVQRVQGLVRGR